jgi:hypothetical protein
MRDTAQRVAEVLAEIGRILLLRLAGGQSVTWCVADHVMDSPPSLRINPYQLCETPVVLAVSATASRHGVSGRGSDYGHIRQTSEVMV